MRNKAYSARNVNEVHLDSILNGRAGDRAWVGVDVSKRELVMVLCFDADRFERPWTVANPLQIPDAIRLLVRLHERLKLIVALEPSGTYGDSFRQAASDAGLVVHRVKTKAAHDHAESFDGVPSQHDGKDAAVVADLARNGRSRAWTLGAPDERAQEMEYWVCHAENHRRILGVWTGRLEAKLARHWPEVQAMLKPAGPTLLRILTEYGRPQTLAQDPAAKTKLARWSRHLLSETKITRLLDAARTTVGVRMSEWDVRLIRDYALAAQEARKQMKVANKRLSQLSLNHATIRSMARVVGVSTACTLWVYLGDPHDYPCAQAYAKAMGLNLAERSSGTYKGRLKISKRGFAMTRYWLYLAAMRLLKEPPVKRWFEAKKSRDGNKGGRAIVAIMRRLAQALWHVGACGELFETTKLFPGGRHARKGR